MSRHQPRCRAMARLVRTRILLDSTPARIARPFILGGFLLLGIAFQGHAAQDASVAVAQAGQDGRRHDPAATMTARSESAPEQLDRVAAMVGNWDVEIRSYAEGAVVHTARGQAEITFMNRGHALMERLRCPDFDGQGHTLDTVAFLSWNTRVEQWELGVANGFTEGISLHTGDFDGETLVLRNARRPRGGAQVSFTRVKAQPGVKNQPRGDAQPRVNAQPGVKAQPRVNAQPRGSDAIEVTIEESLDFGVTWQPKLVRSYTRRSAPCDLLARAEGAGSPNLEDTPPEARQFDFLLGEWNMQHDMILPQGPVQFPAHATAVYCLGGRGIMEFSWMDVDPSMPDASTTIVRLYNRAMRRWESLYMTNRGNGQLHFGGVREGDRIVLHQFEADRTDVPISAWIFSDVKADSYYWHAETSQDHGATWVDSWKIEAARKP